MKPILKQLNLKVVEINKHFHTKQILTFAETRKTIQIRENKKTTMKLYQKVHHLPTATQASKIIKRKARTFTMI